MPKKSDKQRDPTQIVALQVRIREELRAQVEEAAKTSGNSMNSEIADRLALSLREDALLGKGATRRLLVSIADKIALVEERTGARWHEDMATYHATAHFINDTIKRAIPRDNNYTEGAALLREISAMDKREDTLVSVLYAYGVLADQPTSGLARLDPDLPKTVKSEQPQELWYNPDNPKEDLTPEEVQRLQEALEEYRALKERYGPLTERMRELIAPRKEAERRGRELYDELRGDAERQAIQMLSVQHGA